MKGVTILKDEKNNKRILQVDIKEIAKRPAEFENFMDVLVAEARADERDVSWASVKRELKKKGKL
jgi:hypothetical protein